MLISLLWKIYWILSLSLSLVSLEVPLEFDVLWNSSLQPSPTQGQDQITFYVLPASLSLLSCFATDEKSGSFFFHHFHGRSSNSRKLIFPLLETVHSLDFILHSKSHSSLHFQWLCICQQRTSEPYPITWGRLWNITFKAGCPQKVGKGILIVCQPSVGAPVNFSIGSWHMPVGR